MGTARECGDVREIDVVAAGADPRFLQLPSPVYIAEWVSETHVVIGAGGGGSRFGMANVLVLLSIHISRDTLASGSATTTVKLTAEQQKAMTEAAGPGRSSVAFANSADSEAGLGLPQLWRFVAALDLGNDVPWCSSQFLSLKNGDMQGAAAEEDIEHPTPLAWPPAQQSCLQQVCGLIALSSIRNFSLIAVEKLTVGDGEKSADAKQTDALPVARYNLRRMAHIELPNDAANADKKPIALVRHAVLVAHDANGIYAYDLASLLPSAGSDKGQTDGACGVVTTVAPMAQWALPARVNDLHATHVNWILTKPSLMPPRDRYSTTDANDVGWAKTFSVRAIVLDYVLVVALLQDKTLRLGSFRQRARRHHTKPLLERGRDARDHGKETVGEAKAASAAMDSSSILIKEEAVLTGADCGLDFYLMPSSLRLVRLFALESLTAADQAKARRYQTLHSLRHAVNPPPLSLAALLLVAYDQRSNCSFAVHAHVMVSGTRSRYPKEGPLLHCQVLMGRGGPSLIAKDAITCICPYWGASEPAVASSSITSLNPAALLGAVLPTHWLAGTVEGWIIAVVHNPQAGENVNVLNLRRGCGSSKIKPEGNRTGSAVSEKVAAPPFYVLQHTRPSLQNCRGGHVRRGNQKGDRSKHAADPQFPLHSEPVTAVAVSKLHDVITTDLAQNVVLSTLPLPHLRKASGLGLFPPSPVRSWGLSFAFALGKGSISTLVWVVLSLLVLIWAYWASSFLV